MATKARPPHGRAHAARKFPLKSVAPPPDRAGGLTPAYLTDPTPMKLSDFVVSDAILPELAATGRDEAIHEMVDALIAAKAVPKNLRDEMIKSILDREKHGSTGFGKGVAVPHVKHEKIKNVTACVAVSKQGVDFNALDKEPVFSIFLLASPKDRPDEHLQAMENLFANLQSEMFRKFLRQAETVEAVADVLGEADAGQYAR